MSKSKEVLKEIFEFANNKVDETPDAKLVMIGIQFDDDGFPVAKGMRCQAGPALLIAGIELLKNMLNEQLENTFDKLDTMTEMSEKMQSLFEKLGVSDMDDPRIKDLMDGTQDENIKKLLSELKRKFGK
jgi:hypothetical protein